MAIMSTVDELRWAEEPADSLTVRRLYDVLALRAAVFVVEQDCAYCDLDGRDLAADTRHLWADGPEGLAAYARLLGPGDDRAAHIGRVVVAPGGRGTGLGHALVDRAVAACRAAWPEAGIALAAQAHLQGFYAGHGFEPRGEVYLEDGIPHVDMVWTG